MPDEVLFPRYRLGEFALVEPDVQPEIEDDVLVRLTDGSFLLRRLFSRRGGIRLGTYNPADGSLFLREEQVSWIYYVSNPVPGYRIKRL